MKKERPRLEKEAGVSVQLLIRDPEGDKNFMIGFHGSSEKICRAYNSAIHEVLNNAELLPFHQVGVTPDGQDKPGYHAWEVWKKVTKEDLALLLPAIEQRVKEVLNRGY